MLLLYLVIKLLYLKVTSMTIRLLDFQKSSEVERALKMFPKCLPLLGAVLVAVAVAETDLKETHRRLKTAEPGNWTIDNCIVVKMSSQVGYLYN